MHVVLDIDGYLRQICQSNSRDKYRTEEKYFNDWKFSLINHISWAFHLYEKRTWANLVKKEATTFWQVKRHIRRHMHLANTRTLGNVGYPVALHSDHVRHVPSPVSPATDNQKKKKKQRSIVGLRNEPRGAASFSSLLSSPWQRKRGLSTEPIKGEESDSGTQVSHMAHFCTKSQCAVWYRSAYSFSDVVCLLYGRVRHRHWRMRLNCDTVGGL